MGRGRSRMLLRQVWALSARPHLRRNRRAVDRAGGLFETKIRCAGLIVVEEVLVPDTPGPDMSKLPDIIVLALYDGRASGTEGPPTLPCCRWPQLAHACIEQIRKPVQAIEWFREAAEVADTVESTRTSAMCRGELSLCSPPRNAKEPI